MGEQEKLVEYERNGRVATLWLNRPEKLNAVSDDLVLALREALDELDMDDDAWVGIIAGRGRAFSSGADVQQRHMRSRQEMRRLGGVQGRGAKASRLLSESVHCKPVIAAVHGYALGVALGIVLDCDLAVVEEDAKLQLTEVSRGLGGARLVSMMGLQGAGAFGMAVGLTGRMFTGAEAAAAGVVAYAVASGQHLIAATEIAEAIAQNPPLSVRSIVRVHRLEKEQVKQRTDNYTEPLALHLTHDAKESALAFKEKRPPQFRGS